MPQTESYIRRNENSHPQSAFEFLSSLLPARNLTDEVLRGTLEPHSYQPRGELDTTEPLFDRMARRLYRQDNKHLLFFGPQGVGRTAAVQEFALQAQAGRYPYLQDAVFLWFDCSAVGPEDSRSCLEALLAITREHPSTILCLSGIAALFPRANGGTNRPLILTAARRPEVRIIGLMEPHEYQEMIAGDMKLRELFLGIELTEPDIETTQKIARIEASKIERETGQQLPTETIDRAVVLSYSFLFQQAQPGKTVKVLQQACEDGRFHQSQLGAESTPISPKDIDQVMSEITGIPASRAIA